MRDLSTMTALIISLVSSMSVRALEEPDFSVVALKDGIEYRLYAPYMVAETVVEGDLDRDEAANVGFRRLFAYISGDNEVQAEISMAAPVRQKASGTNIAMTAPVRQTPDTAGWTMAFVLPDQFNEATVPRPTDSAVAIRRVPQQLVAALRFSGRWTDSNINHHKSELSDKLSAAGLTPVGTVTMAFYNPPFSLPFLRRNEVLVEVSEAPAGRASASN